MCINIVTLLLILVLSLGLIYMNTRDDSFRKKDDVYFGVVYLNVNRFFLLQNFVWIDDGEKDMFVDLLVDKVKFFNSSFDIVIDRDNNYETEFHCHGCTSMLSDGNITGGIKYEYFGSQAKYEKLNLLTDGEYGSTRLENLANLIILSKYNMVLSQHSASPVTDICYIVHYGGHVKFGVIPVKNSTGKYTQIYVDTNFMNTMNENNFLDYFFNKLNKMEDEIKTYSN